MFQDLLYTIAQVAVTLAGFSGVVFVLGARAEGRFSKTERNGLFHLLLTSCGNALVSLIIAAVLVASADEIIAWRIGSGIVGLFVLFGGVRAMLEQRRGEHSLHRFIAWPIPVVAVILAVTNVLVAAGFFVGQAHIICISLLIYMLLVSVLYFASLLVPDSAP